MSLSKRCARCKTEKPVVDFNKNKGRSDGLQVYCRPCQNTATKESGIRRRQSAPEVYKRQLKESARRRREMYRNSEEYRKQIKLKNRENYLNNPDRRVKQRVAYLKWLSKPGNREIVRDRSKLWKAKNPERHQKSEKNAYLARNYGITLEDYEQMIVEQDSKCKICDKVFSETPNVDHDHSTGEVRGLLCGDCNRAIGLLRDCPDSMQRAASYVTPIERAPWAG